MNGQGGLFKHVKQIVDSYSSIPIVFFGLALDRAWRASVFYYGAFPSITIEDFYVFGLSLGITSLALALASKSSASPLAFAFHFPIASAALMTIGSCLTMLSCLLLLSVPLKIVGLILAGAGSAILYLMWADFFGRISPASVTICFAIAVIGGEALKTLFLGLEPSYLAACAVILPCIAVACARSSMFRLSEDQTSKDLFRLPFKGYPWKPVGLIALCFFVAAFDGNQLRPLNLGNSIGATAASLLILIVVSSKSKHLKVESINQVLFPLFIISFILFLPAKSFSVESASFRFETAYTMLFMLVLIVLSSVSYRYGINPVWLNGIERAVRALVETAGWGLSLLLATNANEDGSVVIRGCLEAVLIIALVVLFFTDKGLSAKWDLRFAQEGDAWDLPNTRTSGRIAEIAKDYRLGPREEEVLKLYSSGKSVQEISDSLFIAPGTVKAHLNHIYRKLDIKGKSELDDFISNPKK